MSESISSPAHASALASCPKFAAAVRGKDVAVIANNPRVHDLHPECDLEVRFNTDPTRKGDIWCTGFSGLFDPNIECDLMVGGLPYCVSHHRGKERDWKARVDRWIPEIKQPLECVPHELWCELYERCDSVPLTGLVMLAMLAESEMQSCTVYGFDFHCQPENRAVRNQGRIGRHKALPSIAYVKQLFRNDRRFHVGEGTRLNRSELAWRLRAAPAALVRFASLPLRLVSRLSRA